MTPSRRRWIGRSAGLLVSFGFLMAAAGWSYRGSDDPSRWSTEQWIVWRDDQIRKILTPTFDFEGRKILAREKVILGCVDAYKVLAPLLDDPDFLPAGSMRAKELDNFVLFVSAQANLARYDASGRYTHALGYKFSDREYWDKASSELGLPPLFTDQNFLNQMSSPAGYRAAEKMIDTHNEELSNERKWIVMTYRSQFLKSADGATYGRMLILIPNQPDSYGGLEDRWIQFAIEASDAPSAKPPLSISEVAVHKGKDGTTKSWALLTDFLRIKDATGKIDVVPTMQVDKNPSKDCYDCHKSPVLPIYPKTVFEIDNSGNETTATMNDSLLRQLNDRIVAYGKCEMGFMESYSYGPTLGQSDHKPSLEAIGAASKESAQRIRDAMRCADCHDGSSKINYPAAMDTNMGPGIFEQKKGLAQTYVESGWMPPNNTLSPDERKLLWRCLASQYFDPKSQTGTFIDWLRGDARSQK